MILILARKELKTLFVSPLAWVVLAVMQVIFAWVFLIQLNDYLEKLPALSQLANPPGITQVVVATLFGFAAIVLLMAVPLMSMRLLSEEQRSHTLTLLMSAPVSTTQIVMGKFLGLMVFLLIAISLLVLMATALAAGGPLDWGLIGANVLGLLLLVAAFSAMGLFISSLTPHAVIAAFGSFGALLLLWIINASVPDPQHPLNYLSLMQHFDSFNRGLIDTRDAAYLLIFSAAFLALTVRRLDGKRLAG